MDLAIRPEQPGDHASVRRVVEQAFGRRNEADLVDKLHAAGRASIALVAVLDGSVVAHLLFSPVTLDPPRASPLMLGLAPEAVQPLHQNKGIGSRLIRAGLEACREAGCDGVVVLGDPAFYSRFGFERASGRGLGNEYGADEHFMALELRKGALDGLRGMVKYGPEFQETGT